MSSITLQISDVAFVPLHTNTNKLKPLTLTSLLHRQFTRIRPFSTLTLTIYNDRP